MQEKEVFSAPGEGARDEDKEVVVVTGSSGLVGTSVIKRLAGKYRLVGLDRAGPPYPPLEAECVSMNLRDKKNIEAAMERVRYGYGDRIASVIHLAAYYDFSGKPSPLYEEVTEEGTRKLLEVLQDFNVDQFIFSSTNLIYKPTEPGRTINEDCPVGANWDYPESKVHTEEIIHQNRGKIPAVLLRIAGVYNDDGHSIPITNQIQRIYERQFTSHFYSGDVNHGNVFIHLDDLVDAIEKTVEKRHELPKEIAINISEPTTPTYQELQERIGQLIHGEHWKTYEMPPALAKAGAYVMDLFGDPFIKPWMIDRADDHYELDITRARNLLDWEPRHNLMDTLPVMIGRLKADPKKWYEENNLKGSPE